MNEAPAWPLRFESIHGGNPSEIDRIAEWYFQEWKIDPEATRKRLMEFPPQGFPFQLLMSAGDGPVATGGLYEHVGLLDVEPRFKAFGPWLALVCTPPEQRRKGYGTLLCEEIQRRASASGMKEMLLYTSTAESLYARMGWAVIERVNLKGRDIVVMRLDLG